MVKIEERSLLYIIFSMEHHMNGICSIHSDAAPKFNMFQSSIKRVLFLRCFNIKHDSLFYFSIIICSLLQNHPLLLLLHHIVYIVLSSTVFIGYLTSINTIIIIMGKLKLV